MPPKRHTAVLGLAVVGLAAASCAAPRPVAIKPRVVPQVKVVEASEFPTVPDGGTLVATTDGAIPGSPTPGAPTNQVVPANWYGYPSILPVVATAPNWVEVRLAQRPNQSTTWVPAKDVTFSVTPYKIVVDLTTEHLVVYQFGKQVMNFPAGIGAPDDPTSTGQYFVTMQVPAPNAGYGPFVLVTSAHSNTITDWEDSGDAIIAIHGPITSYDDDLIGTTGAAISHGCIRLHDADLAQLAMIPAGTPVDIMAS
ncbi:MAG TPA: L,D-transpeptidase family protein [Acidimicrobiales bacterium]